MLLLSIYALVYNNINSSYSTGVQTQRAGNRFCAAAPSPPTQVIVPNVQCCQSRCLLINTTKICLTVYFSAVFPAYLRGFIAYLLSHYYCVTIGHVYWRDSVGNIYLTACLATREQGTVRGKKTKQLRQTSFLASFLAYILLILPIITL